VIARSHRRWRGGGRTALTLAAALLLFVIWADVLPWNATAMR